MKEWFDYSEALKRLKKGKRVSCRRWGNEGKVFIRFVEGVFFNVIVLTGVKRNKDVVFIPSVENQFEDEWYEVK